MKLKWKIANNPNCVCSIFILYLQYGLFLQQWPNTCLIGITICHLIGAVLVKMRVFVHFMCWYAHIPVAYHLSILMTKRCFLWWMWYVLLGQIIHLDYACNCMHLFFCILWLLCLYVFWRLQQWYLSQFTMHMILHELNASNELNVIEAWPMIAFHSRLHYIYTVQVAKYHCNFM